MRLISATWTGWHKQALPLMWFSVIGLITLGLLAGVASGRTPAAALLAPVGFAVGGYAMMWWLRVFSLADEVWLDGDHIVVRDRGHEDRFPVSRIRSARASLMSNPEHIVLTLSEPCLFGNEVVFSPPHRWLRFDPHPLAEELNRRASEARARASDARVAEPGPAPDRGT